MNGDIFLGIVVACAVICVLCLFIVAGEYKAKEKCEDYGKVRVLGTLYECSFKEVK